MKIKSMYYYSTEAVVLSCSVKKVFLEIMQNLLGSSMVTELHSGEIFKENWKQ